MPRVAWTVVRSFAVIRESSRFELSRVCLHCMCSDGRSKRIPRSLRDMISLSSCEPVPQCRACISSRTGSHEGLALTQNLGLERP